MPVNLILQLLPVLISTVTEVTGLIGKVTTTLQQSGELTPDQEKQLDAHIKDLESKPWWQPDK